MVMMILTAHLEQIVMMVHQAMMALIMHLERMAMMEQRELMGMIDFQDHLEQLILQEQLVVRNRKATSVYQERMTIMVTCSRWIQ